MLRQQIISSNKIHNFFGKIRDSSANLHPFLRWQKSTHKETSSFSKLLVLLFSTVLLALLYHFLCLLLRTVNVCVQTLPCLFCTFSPQFNHKKVVKISVSFWVNFPLEVSRERAVMAFLVGQPLCQVEVRASSSHLKSRLEKIFLDPTRLLPSF